MMQNKRFWVLQCEQCVDAIKCIRKCRDEQEKSSETNEVDVQFGKAKAFEILLL